MYLLEAVKAANELRPTGADEAFTAQSVWRVEQLYAEKSGGSAGECPYPYDAPLSIAPPFDNAYVLYAASQNDLMNGDLDFYDIDSALYNGSVKAALSRLRRNTRPKKSVKFKTV